MPIDRENRIKLLRNEMKVRDFAWTKNDHPVENFISPRYTQPIPVDIEQELVSFAAAARGPFFINQLSHTPRVQLTAAIFHPEDRKDFATRFLAREWREIPEAVDANAALLARQTIVGFTYKNRLMARLLKGVHILLQAADGNFHAITGRAIDALAVRVWPEKPARPEQKPRGPQRFPS
jgi:hypothetical protein